jgi:hypothetical protein
MRLNMISISYFTTRLVSPALALNLLIVIMSTTIMAAVTISSAPLVQNAFADHGQEIVLTSKDASFAPVSSGEGGNQVKVVVNYAVHNPMIANDLVKGVMKVYSPDGTLLKTSSSPTPFPISNSYGTATLATTLTDPTIESVTAKIVFTNPIKTETISNELSVSVDLIRGATLSGEPKERTTSQVLPQSESEEAPIEPLSEDKPSYTKSAIASSPTEEEQQPAELKEVPGIQEKKQIKSLESIPQTITNPSIPPTTTMTTTTPAPHIAEETCDDGIDNDSDTLIDSSDEKCNPLQPQQQQKPVVQQEQTMASTPEICDDDLDNDFDGSVDSRDEECNSITTSSFSPPIQEQSVTDEQTGGEDEDTEHQSDEDVSAEPGKNEDGDSEDNKEEDEDTEHQSDDEDNDDDKD